MPANSPTSVAQQSLDCIGSPVVIGDIEDGTREAQVTLRAYGQCLRQLLRAVRWNTARKQVPMVLLGDATGQTPNIGTYVMSPWIYCYSLPIDCMRARFVPWGPQGLQPPIPPGNIVPPNNSSPVVSGLPQLPFAAGARIRPARFLETFDPNFPSQPGAQFEDVQGTSPIGSTVICTNVQNAMLVYTAFIPYPSLWDSQFRAAFVAYLASEIALPLWSAKGKEKFGLELRTQQMAVAKDKIIAARLSDGNEGWSNSEMLPDWFRFRDTGRGAWGGYSQSVGSLGGEGGGIYFGGLDACCGAGSVSAI